jgi:hypothetical protein
MYRNFLSLRARYWSCHVLTIKDADFLSWCEENSIFRELKVRHRRGAGVDEVCRSSYPESLIKAN